MIGCGDAGIIRSCRCAGVFADQRTHHRDLVSRGCLRCAVRVLRLVWSDVFGAADVLRCCVLVYARCARSIRALWMRIGGRSAIAQMAGSNR
jgi:hypothetical protein